MLKKLLIILALSQSNLFAFCIYIDCSSDVATLLANYQIKSTSEFAKVTAQKVALQVKYANYVIELDKFIELQKQDLKLKSAMLLQLKKKEKMLDSRIKMFSLKTKKGN